MQHLQHVGKGKDPIMSCGETGICIMKRGGKGKRQGCRGQFDSSRQCPMGDFLEKSGRIVHPLLLIIRCHCPFCTYMGYSPSFDIKATGSRVPRVYGAEVAVADRPIVRSLADVPSRLLV